MSGDVQPRKRKDKKRKKDDLGVEEPRGTAAVFGEGDVFMHSQHDHGTGGHWCAKVIFFSLLAVLVTLVGLIILENRGLTELEANAVESRYSGVLEGWLEDVHEVHHDEHTLELKHHIDKKGDADLCNEAVEDHDNDENDGDDQDEDESGQEDEDAEHDDEDDDNESDSDEDDEEIEQNKDREDEEYDDNEIDKDDDDEDERDDDEDVDHDGDNEDDDDSNDQLDESEEQNIKQPDDEDEDDERKYRKYYESQEDQDNNEDDDDDDDDDEPQKVVENDSREDDRSPEEEDDNDDEDNDQSLENNDNVNQPKADENDDDESLEDNDKDDENRPESDENDDDESLEDNDNDDDNQLDETPDNEEEPDHGHEKENLDVEVEKIEKEPSDEPDDEPMSTEVPIDSDNKSTNDHSEENSNEQIVDEDVDIEEEEFLEPEDVEEPTVVKRITAPAGKPLPEVEEETSSEKPQDTLAQEEEYEKQQEQLRREKEQASHMWLKVVVGGALLAATHAVVRRVTAPRDEPVSERRASREETPVIDRRMTLIPEEIPPEIPVKPQERYQPIIQREIVKDVPVFTKPVQVQKQESEEEEEIDEPPFTPQNTKTVETAKDEVDRELYSDEDDEEEMIVEKREPPKPVAAIEKEKTPEHDEDSDDVEIIDDEQLDEELMEEEDEEEISDVDDAELLRRLEVKYGRLPEPERPGQKHKDGGNSVEDDWPGEPSEAYWREQLDQAERELRQGEWSGAGARAGAHELRASGRARYVRARALDAAAEARRDNALLTQAVAAYLELLKMNDRLSDTRIIEVSQRTLDRIQFRGNYMGAEPVYRMLIRRFPDVPAYRNNLTVSFLMANRADLAEDVLKETLLRWPDDRIALAHLGFVLKTLHNRLEDAVDAFQKALAGDTGPATEPRFYYHLGDALLLLGRHAEAHEVHKRGTTLGHFLSPSQRSLYNVDRLKGKAWWNIDDTPYRKLARSLENSWKDILKEGEAARAMYEKEKEGLKERGEWSQLDLFVRGREIPDRCKRAPVTCSIVRQEAAAAGCRRGQVKFSSMEAGTHVRPHVGPTNCRLRMHLGLSNTKDTYIRVDQETRQWQLGKVLMFDDSFEHEVWHNGTGTRLVLIVDVWHPDLTPTERRQLPAI